ncbi:MAG TPA: PQQ-dependent sugar dehydrogenase [Candidatus Polarisedimenticolaceae bacterium]|nr:PQQ-dependent sugar dehydrogenase [Candidatus Polarisedimenticolaceae bacterium]
MPTKLSSGMWLVFAVLLAAPAPAQSVQDPHLRFEVIATEPEWLTTMAFIGDEDILALEKDTGKVRRVLNRVLQPNPVLDVAVDSASERGLLGIATDPDFPHNRWVYLYYTESPTTSEVFNDANSSNRVYRYTWNPSTATLTDPRRLLDLGVSAPQFPAVHNGGVIAFGPDDMLYVVVGDLGRSSQRPDLNSGGIMRVDRNGQAPRDNPFYNGANPADPINRFISYGLRNSFGMAFDPVTGDVWESENGPESYDEINHIVRGMNGGWSPIMGPDDRDPESLADLWMAPGSVYRDPEFSWKVPVVPIGMTFVESRILGCDNEHDLLVNDLGCINLYRFELDAARDGLVLTSPALADRVADNDGDSCNTELSEVIFGEAWAVTDMDNAPDGSLYLLQLSFDPTIRRLSPIPGSFPDADNDLVANACDCATADASAFAPPREVPRIRPSGRSPLTLGWNPQRATAGSGTAFSVASGRLSDLRASGFGAACRLGADGTAPERIDNRADPASGDGYYYLVRAANSCGTASYGNGSGAVDPRDTLDAALLPLCP